MKRWTVLFVCFTLFCALGAKAEKKEEIPERYAPILASMNAQTAEELYQSTLDYMGSVLDPEQQKYYTYKRYPCKIRFGGTTKELIQDKKNWGIAIVSSKEVNLQTLADKGIIQWWGFSPISDNCMQRRQLPREVWHCLPSDVSIDYMVYVYDYDKENDDATLIIYNKNAKAEWTTATILLDKRSPEQIRALEGVNAVTLWSVEDLLARPEDWDVARMEITIPDDLDALDRAGLLYDFSKESDLASRQAPASNGYHKLESGLYSADRRMLAIPCALMCLSDPANRSEVLLVNQKSKYLDKALDYVRHYTTAFDWYMRDHHDYKYKVKQADLVELGLWMEK